MKEILTVSQLNENIKAILEESFGTLWVEGEVSNLRRPQSGHVYFTLKDKSPQAKAKLLAACKKYLSGHPGTVWFAAGARAEEFARDVNDAAFDVALHVVFKDKAAHDVYQVAEKHLKFIQENKDSWEKVRVFDSYLDISSHEEISVAAEPAKH